MIQIRTDLAIENREFYQEQNDGEVPGIKVEEEIEENYTITRVRIIDEIGSNHLEKPKGVYITIEVPKLKSADQDLKDEISQVVAKEIKGLGLSNEDTKTLIVGLGNWNVTPDALGPKVVDRVLVTRQYFVAYNKKRDETVANVAKISPGVMGLTGIETGEIVKGIVEKTKPDLVIAVDSLASRRMERVSTTIQISNTGIIPGSGIGNKRTGLNEEYLGVPVVAIGVPTVVDAATMINDTMDLIIGSMRKVARVGTEFYSTLERVSREDRYQLIKEVLEPYMTNVVVTPKEIDLIIDDLSIIIGNGLNMALHHGIELKDVNRYIR
ncbi:GPR endopeptidase [Tepidimicrobium xylanilyticum]|uniref:Spore protease n=1 Tax=Tepidimicrobium xylanilyticum TaxID=1123352 RepID=A0A1H2T5C9_9FIRM|nr:GPR endopeptidase [Tepidimicrobium xylanilyticum]GMG96022.1 germination protease [Tepidimicrobium xylanilyticum]SDW39153.1 spore protease [Tepidimicrobium xylanilyticum]